MAASCSRPQGSHIGCGSAWKTGPRGCSPVSPCGRTAGRSAYASTARRGAHSAEGTIPPPSRTESHLSAKHRDELASAHGTPDAAPVMPEQVKRASEDLSPNLVHVTAAENLCFRRRNNLVMYAIGRCVGRWHRHSQGRVNGDGSPSSASPAPDPTGGPRGQPSSPSPDIPDDPPEVAHRPRRAAGAARRRHATGTARVAGPQRGERA